MASNQFLAFAEGGSANTLTPTAYAALATLIANGYQTGIANSQQINTTLRQSSFMAAVIGQIVADAGNDALDNGDIATFKSNFLKAVSLPVSSLILCTTVSAPSGYLLCDGAAISRTAYAALFAAIGTFYGAGDGSTTFNIPDCRNRMPVGAGSLYLLGAKAGNKDAIVVSHSHTASDSGHSHGVPLYNAGTSSGPDETLHRARGSLDTITSNTGTANITVNSTGSSGTDANMPPYIAVNFAIKY